ncbi:signal peptide peptidase SppA [Ghiorsea bivora]|uniref:signal peptide peptidase SppA n=1 Tax=Ghiorsea bivora TaxID=1485545 RepID=UPI0005701B6E|nr:signal peptide peptidase SppA [Ghiorsea bivora]
MKTAFLRLMKGIENIRYVMVNMLFLFLVGFLLYTLMQAQPTMPERAILQLDLKGALVEQVKRPSFGLSALTNPEPKQVKVHDVVMALEMAAKDERIKGVRLDLSKLSSAALPHLQEIRHAIETFKASGKPVMAYADNWTQAQYYLAAAANDVYLHPMGNIALQGYAVYRNYIKDALDKLGVDVHVFRAGKYKSAAAPLIQNAMSDAEREADSQWLNTLWDVYKTDIQNMRGIKTARLQQVLDTPVASIKAYDGDLGKFFMAEGWVDGLLYPEQADAKLQAKTGPAELVDYKSYLMANTSLLPSQPQDVDNWVGIITGSGQILSGEQPSGTIGSDTMVELLQTALHDTRIKAVVLRLNTPGGSAQASESIRHAVEVLRQHGKPVVVSMGSMAASGGYWIASAANEIWASPATITGSIGVFGIVPNISHSLEKLGVHTDGLGTTKLAGAMRIDKPLTAELAASIQLSIHQIYKQFIGHVAQGRKMPTEKVESLAQGRVWSGRDAKDLGLVDALGDMDAAIQAAARLAHIEKSHTAVEVTPPMNALEFMMENILSEVLVSLDIQPSAMVDMLMQTLHVQDDIFALNDPRGIYALSDIKLK